MDHGVFIGMGSNQGDKIKNCERAVEKIRELEGCSLVAQSSWYKTEPWGKSDQDWFINGVVQGKTRFSPQELLSSVKKIEFELGREDSGRWGLRTIDIDLLFYDQLMIKTSDLEIPHPWVHQRNFVLVPLAEIAPHLVHPVFKKNIQHLLDNISDQKKVIKVTV